MPKESIQTSSAKLAYSFYGFSCYFGQIGLESSRSTYQQSVYSNMIFIWALQSYSISFMVSLTTAAQSNRADSSTTTYQHCEYSKTCFKSACHKWTTELLAQPELLALVACYRAACSNRAVCFSCILLGCLLRRSWLLSSYFPIHASWPIDRPSKRQLHENLFPWLICKVWFRLHFSVFQVFPVILATMGPWLWHSWRNKRNNCTKKLETSSEMLGCSNVFGTR